MSENKEISLRYLFLTFFRIGAISWGGFMALIAVIKKQLVDKDRVIGEDAVLDGISLASVLPGAVAINVATYIGYQLRGTKGALVSLTATILPGFFLIILLGAMYAAYGELPVFDRFFMGILPAIVAVIGSVATDMARKQVKDWKQLIICLLSVAGMWFIHSFLATLAIILLSALAGYLLYRSVENTKSQAGSSTPRSLTGIFIAPAIFLVLLILVVIACYLGGIAQTDLFQSLKTIFLTFTGMSVTLFGGGYVIVPAMQSVVVDGFHWLSSREFSDAIAMGQITPGPVIITATFIGYRVAGFLGACAATIGIFYPPGFVMILMSGFLDRIKNSGVVTAIFNGMRPAIIGMIFSAALTVGKEAHMTAVTGIIFLVSAILIMKFKVNVAWLIPLAGLAGLLFF